MEVITEHTIDKVKYIVVAKSSETATETLHKKIEKLLIRDLERMMENAENADISAHNG